MADSGWCGRLIGDKEAKLIPILNKLSPASVRGFHLKKSKAASANEVPATEQPVTKGSPGSQGSAGKVRAVGWSEPVHH